MTISPSTSPLKEIVPIIALEILLYPVIRFSAFSRLLIGRRCPRCWSTSSAWIIWMILGLFIMPTSIYGTILNVTNRFNFESQFLSSESLVIRIFLNTVLLKFTFGRISSTVLPVNIWPTFKFLNISSLPPPPVTLNLTE